MNNSPAWCSGFGQWHSTNNEKDPRPYITTTLKQIEEMAAAPPSVAKDQAQWAIFSTLPSRVHAEQRESGTFQGSWADIDEQPDGLTFEDITDRARNIIPSFIAYTSRSATKDKQKTRIIVPLAHPVSGADFVVLQKILNDKLQAAGIIPDRATERAGQLCYLPNRGEFYRYEIVEGTPLPASAWADDVEREWQGQQAEEQAQMERREQARAKAIQRAASGGQSPIDAFNAATDLLLLAESYGYVQKGKRLLSPNSESGVPGVTIMDDGKKWFSAHSSDAAIGTPTASGTMGDAFDLFLHYQHGGDIDQALREAAKMFNCKAKEPAPENNEKPKPRRLSFTPASELTGFQEPTNWLVKRYLEAGGAACLFAPPESLKTFLVLDMGLSIATGREWHGQKVKAGPVLYICGEARRNIGRRIAAWGKQHNVQADKFFVSSCSAALLDPMGIAELEAAADAIATEYGNPELLIIDTLNRNFGPGDENSTTDMTRFIAALDRLRERLQCAILIVHHTGLADAGRGRGNSALRGALDFEYCINSKRGATIEDAVVELSCSKCKDHDRPPAMAFRPVVVDLGLVDDDMRPMTSLILERTEYTPRAKQQEKRLPPQQRIALEALKEATRDGQQTHIDEWRQAAYRKGIADTAAAKRQAFSRARTALVDSGIVVVENDFYSIVTKRDIGVTCHGMSRGPSVTERDTPFKGVTHVTVPAQEGVRL